MCDVIDDGAATPKSFLTAPAEESLCQDNAISVHMCHRIATSTNITEL